MTERTEMIDRLNEVHTFPDTYMFKVIGDNSEVFVSAVLAVIDDVVEPDEPPEVSRRESSAGNHLSVTVSVVVDDAESVLEVYDGFDGLDEARFVM